MSLNLWYTLAAVGLLCSILAPAVAQSGPTPPPENPEDWPGKGAAGVFDLWTQRRQEFWDSRRKDQGAVVFFGDSITHRWENVAEVFPEVKVANRGIGGDSSRRLVFRVKEDVLDLNPRAIVILIGINDLLQGRPPSNIGFNLRLILEQIQKHDPATPVVLCRVMPCNLRPEHFPARIRQANALLDGLALGRPNVTVCDTWPGLATPEGGAKPEFFPDGVHMNAGGYEAWARNLRPVLARAGILPGA
jgi:lysophospholipase L1-like esterase